MTNSSMHLIHENDASTTTHPDRNPDDPTAAPTTTITDHHHDDLIHSTTNHDDDDDVGNSSTSSSPSTDANTNVILPPVGTTVLDESASPTTSETTIDRISTATTTVTNDDNNNNDTTQQEQPLVQHSAGQNPDDVVHLLSLSPRRPSAVTSSNLLEQVQGYKDLGNVAFNNGNSTSSSSISSSSNSSTNHKHTETEQQRKTTQYQEAVRYYTLGINILEQALQQQQEPKTIHDRSNENNNNTNENDNDPNPSHNNNNINYSNLVWQLLSNRSLVYIKMQQYLLAEDDCSRILDHNIAAAAVPAPHVSSSSSSSSMTNDPKFMTKVWFRRGWAREQYAHQLRLLVGNSTQTNDNGIPTTTSDTATMTILQHYIDNSKRDLQQCLQMASTTTTTTITTATPEQQMSPKQIQLLKQQVIPVVQQLAQLQKQVHTMMAAVGVPESDTTTTIQTNHTPPPTPTAAVPLLPPPPPPSLLQQRIHIMELLTNHANISNSMMLEGEAYFLLDWKWWCQFCTAVQLFTSVTTTKNNTGTSTNDPNILLRGLPPGATIPDRFSDDDDDDDDEEDKDMNDVYIPGPIDNTSLLLLLPQKKTSSATTNGNKPTTENVDRIYNKHWFRPYYHTNDTATTSSVPITEFTNEKNNDKNNDRGDNRTSPAVAQPPLQHPIVPLRPNLVRGYHFEIIPREVYYALRSWYLEVTPPICRRVILKTANGHYCVTLYPLSWHDTAVPTIPARVVPIEAMSTNGINGGTGECGNCGAMNVILKCRSCMSINYCDRGCQESDWNTHKNECKAIVTQQKRAGNNPTTPPQRPIRARGRTGLNNLGNTCFMNSAIQCLSHATPLTRHFLSGRYQLDINRSNPLGTGGQLAVAYAETIKLLHHSRATSSISPIKLKHAIAMFAPRFAGFLQHDAQEFLAYLLDGLHEDVNRIRNAPYVEMPDVTDGQCIAIAGANAWEAHRKRNDSVVLDTFYGQFKSTCVCPKCQRVSVSFDVYNHVSLEIPQETNENIPMVVIVYASPSVTNPFPKPTRYAVSIRRNTNIVTDLTHALSAMCQIPFERLHICEEHHGVITIHEGKKPLSAFRNNVLIAFDLHPLHATSEKLEPVFHAVLTNQLIVPDETLAENEEPPMSKITVPATNERIGIPILTSFSASYTCREVWNHIWSILDFYVARKELHQKDPAEPSPMDIANDLDVRSMLQIRLVVQTNGKERLVFPVASGSATDRASNQADTIADESKDVEMMDATESEIEPQQIIYTSILPRDSDDTLLKYVGIDQLRNFVYFDCVWSTPETETNDNGVTSGEAKVDATPSTMTTTTTNTFSIDEDRFYSVMNHSSYLDYMVKSKEVASKKVVTLDECLDTFTRPERLDAQNMWYCSHCKDHVQALKTMELWKLPNVLIIHLKRFEYKHSLRRDKLDHLVDFPLYGLDMNQHCGKFHHDHKATTTTAAAAACVDSYVPAIYDCFAVVNHYGRMGFGHYTAYARSWNEQGFVSSTDDWHLYDDSQVRTVHDERAVVSSAAYVLLYRRRIFH